MNERDSEQVARMFVEGGYTLTRAEEDADAILVNTCSVRERAEQKVWSRLGDMRNAKQDRPDLVVGVLGCMAERDGTDLMTRMPVVDIMCGPA